MCAQGFSCVVRLAQVNVKLDTLILEYQLAANIKKRKDGLHHNVDFRFAVPRGEFSW